jgi:hypothetical protein
VAARRPLQPTNGWPWLIKPKHAGSRDPLRRFLPCGPPSNRLEHVGFNRMFKCGCYGHAEI